MLARHDCAISHRAPFHPVVLILQKGIHEEALGSDGTCCEMGSKDFGSWLMKVSLSCVCMCVQEPITLKASETRID